jgi:hypothetical protein
VHSQVVLILTLDRFRLMPTLSSPQAFALFSPALKALPDLAVGRYLRRPPLLGDGTLAPSLQGLIHGVGDEGRHLLKKEAPDPLSRKPAAQDAGIFKCQQKTAVHVANVPAPSKRKLIVQAVGKQAW